MSGAARDAVAVPTDGSMEALQRRLLDLRAEIDAILDLFERQKAQPSAAQAPIPSADDERPVLGASAQPLDQSETDLTSLEPVPDLDAVEINLTSPEAAVAAEPALTAQISELDADGAEATGDAMPTLATDAEPTPAVDAAIAEAETQSEVAVEVAEPSAAAAMPTEPTVAAAEAPAAVSDIPGPMPVVDAPALIVGTPSAAQAASVIAFEPRHRKHKDEGAAGKAPPVRPRHRRIAARIAASIVALIAAATALGVADRTLVGSAYSLPGKSSLPAYMPSDAIWPYLDQVKRAIQGAVTGSGAARMMGSPLPNEALALRYREIWPTSR